MFKVESRFSIDVVQSRKLLTFLLIVFTIQSFGQSWNVNGVVLDSVTREPLPFVNIVINDGPSGGISDLDGKFSINAIEKPKSLKMSYVGYYPKTIELSVFAGNVIELQRSTYQLSEVIILPGENPAHRIINNAIDHKEQNNPFSLQSFSYTSYNRFFVSPDMDVLRIRAADETDTTIRVYRDFFEQHYLFLMESVSKRKFMKPNLSEEVVMASRVAGFSDPIFTLLMTQIQSFAFYDDLIAISEKNYVNPISKGSTDKYFFLIEDTLYDGKDSIFVISYRPSRGKNFDALQGLLYIHTDRWALQSVTAAPARDEKGVGIRIRQQYERVGENAKWFPSQLNTEIVFKNVSLNKLEVYGQGRTYLFDVEIDPELKKRQFSDAQIVFDDSEKRGEELLKMYSKELGSHKDSTTYAFLDSLGKENNFDRLVNLMKVLMESKIPLFVFDIPLFDLVNFNDFEGWRLGFGLETNRKLMKKISLGGYGAWGFDDERFKYGAHIKYSQPKWRDFALKLSYAEDVTESGGKQFFDFKTAIIDPSSYRTFYVDLMDYYRRYNAEVSFRLARKTNMHFSFAESEYVSGDDYLFGSQNLQAFTGSNVFHAALLSVGIHYDPNVKTIRGLDYQLGLLSNSGKPSFKVEYQTAQSGIAGDYTFHAVDFQLRKNFYTKYLGTSSFMLQSGFIDRSVPYAFMRVIPAAYRKFGVYVPYSFLTVRMNEFVSDVYVYVFWRHQFGKLLMRTKYFSPSLSLVLNSGYGSVRSPQRHYNRLVVAPEKGIFEGGIVVDDVFTINAYSLGVAAIYRIGHYSNKNAKDNLCIALSLRAAF